MHPLTILAVGLYGETLPNQNGAPLRLVVPWKYGFKSIKSIVRISLTESSRRRPGSAQNADEYGFYSNVNPKVDHPRWSQATERRIGEGRLVRQAPADADVQRLRRPGRQPLQRPRSQSELLICRRPPPQPLPRMADRRRSRPPRLYIVGLVPAVWYFYLGVTDQLGADPLNVLERTLGLWALRFLIAALAITPLRRLGGPNLIRYRRAIGLLAFYLRDAASDRLHGAGSGSRCRGHHRRHRQAALHHRRHAGLPDPGAARRHVEQRHDQAARRRRLAEAASLGLPRRSCGGASTSSCW